ncbi:MAG: hypothetical protein QOD65_2146 [Gaiellales bacterium]|nr:hypothetical protein [Gaiellales bacterium]
MSDPLFVLADGPFVDGSIVEQYCATAGVQLKRAVLDSPGAVARETAGAAGVLVVTNPLTRVLIEAFAPSVRLIGRAGAGLDAIDLEAAADRGIGVFYTPDYCVDEVATHAVALALALNRKVVEGNALVRSDWAAWRRLAPVRSLSEQTAGVVGLGRIGRAVIARLRPLVGEIVGYDPWSQGEVEGVRRVETLGELLTESDLVTLHVPLTSETRGLIDAQALALMKPTAHLVNVARGGLIDETALAEALGRGAIGGAGLDVLSVEPAPPDHPLLSVPGVVLSPHFAWYSTSSERRVWTMTIDGMLAVLAGCEPASGQIAVQAAGTAA